MSARPSLSLAEWTVLTVLAERPAHGFAIAQLTAPGGELGRIWHIPRPVIYRAIGRLLDAGLITPDAVEPGRGPQRTLYTVTPQGREAAADWLNTPVEHVRDVRSHLLLKLACSTEPDPIQPGCSAGKEPSSSRSPRPSRPNDPSAKVSTRPCSRGAGPQRRRP